MEIEIERPNFLKEVEPVKELYPTTSKWDVTIKGKTVRFKLLPCQCGVQAVFVYDVPVKVALPPGLADMLPMPRTDQTVEKIYAEWHWHPKWWEKYILLRTLRGELGKFIKEVHSGLIQLRDSDQGLEDLKNFAESL